MTQKRIFITGGASGLGRALAERYAREGWAVCIGDIHPTRGDETLQFLRELGAKSHSLRCDVTREEDLQAAADWLLAHWGGVDVLVNNAGVGCGGEFSEIPLDDWKWIIDINLLGVVRGCQVFAPIFKRQGHGQFINIASAAGLMHMPLMSAYNATKAAVVGLSETLRFELEPFKISVSVVCPTFFRTNLTETQRVADPQLASITQRLVNQAKIGAEQIADAVYKSAERQEFLILPNHEAKIAWFLKRLVPFSLYRFVILSKAKENLGRGTLGLRPS